MPRDAALRITAANPSSSRRRRIAFKLLTVMDTIYIFAAVPFKFSGNSIAFFWMIASDLLIAAGVLQPEIVFQRLGLSPEP